MRVGVLAWELPHVLGMVWEEKKKKKNSLYPQSHSILWDFLVFRFVFFFWVCIRLSKHQSLQGPLLPTPSIYSIYPQLHSIMNPFFFFYSTISLFIKKWYLIVDLSYIPYYECLQAYWPLFLMYAWLINTLVIKYQHK